MTPSGGNEKMFVRPLQEALLRSAVRKLGPERSEQALRAFNDNPVASYCGCALAHAYGNPCESVPWPEGNLARDLFADDTIRSAEDVYRIGGGLLGLAPEEFCAISTAHCGWYARRERDADAALLVRLLTEEASKIQSPQAVPERAPAAQHI